MPTSDPWDGTTWGITAPDIDQSYGNAYKEIYDLRKGIAIRMNKEHETLATSSADGVHKQGSARIFFQDAAPTTQVDTSAFDSGDLGLMWCDSNSTIDNEISILTATTPTWTPISTNIIATLLAANRQFAGTLTVDGATTLTGAVGAAAAITLGAGADLIGSTTSDITIGTTAFTVAGATGNVSVGGTFESVGVATLADTSVTKTTAAPAADAQITNKKYVDDQNTAQTSGLIKAWVSFDGDTGTINGTGYNVTSVTRTAAGTYTIAWDTNFADDDYAIAGFCSNSSALPAGVVCNGSTDTPLSVGEALIETKRIDGAAADYELVTVIAIGDQ